MNQCVLGQSHFLKFVPAAIMDLAPPEKEIQRFLGGTSVICFVQKVHGNRINHEKHFGQRLTTELRFWTPLFYRFA